MEGGIVLIEGIVKTSHAISTFVQTTWDARQDMLQVDRLLGQLRRTLHNVLNDVQPDDCELEGLRDWVYSIVNGCLAIKDDIYQTIQEHQNLHGFGSWALHGEDKVSRWIEELETYIGHLTLILNTAEGPTTKDMSSELTRTPHGYRNVNEDGPVFREAVNFLQSQPRSHSGTQPPTERYLNGSNPPRTNVNVWLDSVVPANNHMANQSPTHRPQASSLAQPSSPSQAIKRKDDDADKMAVRDEFKKMAWEAAGGVVAAPKAPKAPHTRMMEANFARPARTSSAEKTCSEFKFRIRQLSEKQRVDEVSSGSRSPVRAPSTRASRAAESRAQKYIDWLKKEEFRTKVLEGLCRG